MEKIRRKLLADVYLERSTSATCILTPRITVA